MIAHMDELGRVDPRGALIKREAGIQYVLVAAIIPVALGLFTPTECRNFIRHCGYRIPTAL